MVSYMEGVARKDAQEFSANIQEIGPMLASEMLATMQYEHQRPIRADHVKMLVGEIRAGRFVPGTTLRIAYVDGTPMLIDGQHRLSAIVASGIPQTFIVLEEAAPNTEYVAWAYGNLDIGKTRAPSDLYKAMGLAERLELTRTQINILAPAVDFLAAGMKPGGKTSANGRVDRAERIRLMILYAPHMRRFVSIIQGSDKFMARAMERSYVVSVALLTMRFSEPYIASRSAPGVADFWRGVAFDDKIAADDPRKVANRHLLTTTMTSPRNAVGVRTVTTGAHGARHMALCFNAYMARLTRKFARVVDDTAPVNLYGVPRDIEAWTK